MLELSLHVLDAMQNAVEAGATHLHLSIVEDLEKDWMVIGLRDNGRGMGQDFANKVLDPFVTSRNTRHVGMGFPLFAAAARRCEGDFQIKSTLGKGTSLHVTFRLSHWDRAPLGDMPAALVSILLAKDRVDIDYLHQVGSQKFSFNSQEVRKELGEVPVSSTTVASWILECLKDGERSLLSPGGGEHLKGEATEEVGT